MEIKPDWFETAYRAANDLKHETPKDVVGAALSAVAPLIAKESRREALEEAAMLVVMAPPLGSRIGAMPIENSTDRHNQLSDAIRALMTAPDQDPISSRAKFSSSAKGVEDVV